MKPRLRYIGFLGLWFCSLPGGRSGQPLGIGITPTEAYDDWLLLELAR